MQQARQTERFNDGVVSLHGAIREGAAAGSMDPEPLLSARFGNRIVGEGQYYGAMAADVKISRRIRIPLCKKIDTDAPDLFYAVIEGTAYEVKRAQHYLNTVPPCTDLTLSKKRRKR